MKRKASTLWMAALLTALAATPAWAAWTYIGPGARSVHLTLPTAPALGRASVVTVPAVSSAPFPSPSTLQDRGLLSGVLAHNLHGWNPNRWVPAGHAALQTAIERLVPGHQIRIHPGLILPTVSWPVGSASVALYHIARYRGILIVVTQHRVYVMAG
ncbi:hypothetical protein Acife_0421 [Acidithiobacillus ferrivorans SS3]|uniref:Uncharacterized protein n=2 Tax=Acidithiobacillus ferrivorans TaxID=160808 RepID=G0JT87_9PROT|nr:hypothetical protein Acife_0421 [Acidithiobacillus ferrivorans SS3]